MCVLHFCWEKQKRKERKTRQQTEKVLWWLCLCFHYFLFNFFVEMKITLTKNTQQHHHLLLHHHHHHHHQIRHQIHHQIHHQPHHNHNPEPLRHFISTPSTHIFARSGAFLFVFLANKESQPKEAKRGKNKTKNRLSVVKIPLFTT